jgi:serine/threonine-protein kinase
MASRFGQAAILSGLLNVEGLNACWNAIPPEKREAPEHIDRRLARQAVQSQALTLWQAQQLLAGRTSGFKVDRYILLELIGQGGMGRVYLARDTRLNRRVALKILAPERISNPRAVARFQREARVGAQLQHENLVRVYDFGESSGRYFLVMEFIEGKTIGYLLSEQGPMPPATAARLVRQVAQGLAHADRKGLIHRDVNPYNIMVTHDGVAKLADLGLAIDLSEGDRVTREGATVGTFDYVAPEQARHSHSADIRSDIYSLGCTLYHMLTGQVPFPSPSLPEKLFAHQAMEPTPLEQIVPGLPGGLGDVVRTMMRKLPDERYSSPSQVVQVLEPYIDDGAGFGRIEPMRSATESSARPAAGGRGSPAPESVDELRPSTPGSDVSSEGGADPVSPRPERDRVLAATMATPVTVISAVRAATPRPANPVGGTAVAGSATPASADIDDQSLPLLTPTDDVPPAGIGLPIEVDLGPEPPLRTSAVRPRPSSGVGLSAIFSRAAGSDRPTGTTADARATSGARSGSFWRTLPLWGRAAIFTVAVAFAVFALLGVTGRLTTLWKLRRSPATSPRATSKSGTADPSRRPPSEGPTIVVRSVGSGAGEGGDVAARTLLDAVKAAMGRGKDGFVELRNLTPMPIGPGDFLDLSTWRGTIDLRAAPGMHPVIEVQMDAGHPFLSTGSGVSLSLSGLTIRVRYRTTEGARPSVIPPVIQAAGRVQLDRCAFEVVGPRPDGCRALNSDGGSLFAAGCWFLGFDQTIRVRAYDETATEIRQTMIVPEAGAVPGSGPAPELRGWAVGVQLLPGRSPTAVAKRRLILDHCTIEGAGLLEITGDPGPSPLPAEISHCAVRTETLLAWQPRKPGDRLDADLRWKGAGNQFQVIGRSWVVMSAGTMSPALSLGVTDPPSWAKFVTSEAEPIRTRILFQTDPQQRTGSPRPRDFAIDSADPPADRAGADPDLVGPRGP